MSVSLSYSIVHTTHYLEELYDSTWDYMIKRCSSKYPQQKARVHKQNCTFQKLNKTKPQSGDFRVICQHIKKICNLKKKKKPSNKDKLLKQNSTGRGKKKKRKKTLRFFSGSRSYACSWVTEKGSENYSVLNCYPHDLALAVAVTGI